MSSFFIKGMLSGDRRTARIEGSPDSVIDFWWRYEQAELANPYRDEQPVRLSILRKVWIRTWIIRVYDDDFNAVAVGYGRKKRHTVVLTISHKENYAARLALWALEEKLGLR